MEPSVYGDSYRSGRGAGAVLGVGLSCHFKSAFDPHYETKHCDEIWWSCSTFGALPGSLPHSVCIYVQYIQIWSWLKYLNIPVSPSPLSTSCLGQMTSTSTCGKSQRIQKQVSYCALTVDLCTQHDLTWFLPFFTWHQKLDNYLISQRFPTSTLLNTHVFLCAFGLF